MTYSHQLADFVCGLTTEAIPSTTRSRARQLITDTLGVGLSGTRHENFTAALAGAQAIPGSVGQSAILGHTLRLALPFAAMVNGVACHVLDYDDTHTASIVHGSAILAPLVLALGSEIKVSRADVLTAFIAGWEVAARIGRASGNSFHNRGFHATALAGVFGATAAAGWLLRLTPAQMTHAFGLCASQASGINEFLTNSSSSKGYHVGWAAKNGIIVAYLAQNGATGPKTVFEGDRGIFHTHGHPELCCIQETVAKLGTRWEIERVSIKPYPCCHFAQGAVDCALKLHDQGIQADQIEKIHAIIDAVAAGFVCTPITQKYAPVNAYGAKFSLPFLIACAVIDGQVDQDSFTDGNIRREDLNTLGKRVTYEEAEKGTTGFPTYFPGHLVTTLKDGRVIEACVPINRGNPDAPLSDKDITQKFRKNAGELFSPEQINALLDLLSSFDTASADLSELIALLTLDPSHTAHPL